MPPCIWPDKAPLPLASAAETLGGRPKGMLLRSRRGAVVPSPLLGLWLPPRDPVPVDQSGSLPDGRNPADRCAGTPNRLDGRAPVLALLCELRKVCGGGRNVCAPKGAAAGKGEKSIGLIEPGVLGWPAWLAVPRALLPAPAPELNSVLLPTGKNACAACATACDWLLNCCCALLAAAPWPFAPPRPAASQPPPSDVL